LFFDASGDGQIKVWAGHDGWRSCGEQKTNSK
jgi:hypothetical protein